MPRPNRDRVTPDIDRCVCCGTDAIWTDACFCDACLLHPLSPMAAECPDNHAPMDSTDA